MVSTVNYAFGSSTEVLSVPEWLKGNWEHGAFTISLYRSFLIGVSVIVLACLWGLLEYTTFGAQLRASVDNAQMARCIGINVPRVFALTFSVGCALAAMGGALGSPLLPLNPWYALKFLVLALMVVSVGGMGSLKGSFFAALLLGVLDTFGRYYVPAAGAFVIYLTALAVLVWRPNGLYGRA
jgi:branched-chain amino acid transport system permease protein